MFYYFTFWTECIKTKTKKRTIWIIVLVLSALCFIAGLVYLVPMVVQSFKMSDLQSSVTSFSDSAVLSDNVVETPVDFKTLQKANSDIYAWINIPGTEIDYPILQKPEDNTYYLTHTINGEKTVYGSIFTENYNKKDFSDFNTVIYGHNMKNGTMFGSLKKYKDLSYFNQNQEINVYLPGRILKYKIFAAYTWDSRHILLSLDFSNLAIRSAYLDMVYSIRDIDSHINNDIKVTESEKIITLSTCTNSDDKRFLVQGVLIYDSKDQ